MVHNVKDLSPDQRLVIESLLGGRSRMRRASRYGRRGSLRTLHPARRTRLFRTYLDHHDPLAGRVQGASEAEIDAANDDAIQHVRHRADDCDVDTSILFARRNDRMAPAQIVNALALNPDHVIALSPFILGEVGRS